MSPYHHPKADRPESNGLSREGRFETSGKHATPSSVGRLADESSYLPASRLPENKRLIIIAVVIIIIIIIIITYYYYYYYKLLLLRLRPIWSNSQLVELLKQDKIWFSGLTDMPVGTPVVIMNRSRLVPNRLLLLYIERLTHKIWQIIHVLIFW